MQRLKYKLLKINKSTTYKELYEGKMDVVDLATGNTPIVDYDPTYYYENIAFHFSTTNRLALDKPTVTISIPVENLKIHISNDPSIRNAIADFCLRRFNSSIEELNEFLSNEKRPDTENGKYYLCNPGNEIVHRNAAYFCVLPLKDYTNGSGDTVFVHSVAEGAAETALCICFMIQIQLPQNRIKKTIQMLCKDLPNAVKKFITNFDHNEFREAMVVYKKQVLIRQWLKRNPYIAFIASDSILPRMKDSDLPLYDGIPFQAPLGEELTLFGIRGFAIPRGITIITGGGYSGKSTILNAISHGIYPHVIGDGRELCITDDTATTIAAEDGRCIKSLNISPFFEWLPNDHVTSFSTEHASGATSQAANIIEAIDAGAKTLLFDEDKCAANFMTCSSVMKKIKREAITPFVDRAYELFCRNGISTILVTGGNDEFFPIATNVYLVQDYKISNITGKVKRLLQHKQHPNITPAIWIQKRKLLSDNFSSRSLDGKKECFEILNSKILICGEEQVNMQGLLNIVSNRQFTTLGLMLRYLENTTTNSKVIDIQKEVDSLFKKIEIQGMDFLYTPIFSKSERFLDLPRKYELFFLINRMRETNYLNI